MSNNAIYLEMVLTLGHKFQYDQLHATAVERLSVSLFEQLRNIHQLGESELTLLRHGALLHDIGIFISAKKHHKHSAYLVLHDRGLDGYPQKERTLLALLVRNHRKEVKIESPNLSRFSKQILKKLIALLRIADALDYFHRGQTVVKDVRIQDENCIFTVEGLNLDALGEQLRKKGAYFREAFGLNAVFASTDTPQEEPLNFFKESDIEDQPTEYDNDSIELHDETTAGMEQGTGDGKENLETQFEPAEEEPMAEEQEILAEKTVEKS